VFDPLKLASSEDQERNFRLKTAEIKHGRLAMVAFLGEWQTLALRF
jgi:light-harvesting complex II chlorophyll a/b binding protein 4